MKALQKQQVDCLGQGGQEEVHKKYAKSHLCDASVYLSYTELSPGRLGDLVYVRDRLGPQTQKHFFGIPF